MCTSGSMSTVLPAAISNEYIFIIPVTAYAFKQAGKDKLHGGPIDQANF